MSETNIVTFRRHILESENPLHRPFQQPALDRYYASFFDSWEPRFSKSQFSESPNYPHLIEIQSNKFPSNKIQLKKSQTNKSQTNKFQTNIPWIIIIILLSLIFLLK